jgi:beta-lactamase regulating signal transducer with metallopeptidase domain/DUF4097 and DUF4098 domain-containing protein YvlB
MRDVIGFIGDFVASASFPLLLVLKSTLIMIAGGCVVLALRNKSAAKRYTVWALTFAAVVALPLGMFGAPAWKLPVADHPPIVNNSPARVNEPVASEPRALQPSTVSAVASNVQTSIERSFPPELPLYMWMLGTLMVLLRMAIGRVSVEFITRRASRLDGSWMSLLEHESRILEIDRPVRLLKTSALSSPVAAGVFSPVILLPRDADSWDDAHRTVVLRHELAHIARGDAFICLVAGIASALYWFNPLVWIAERRLRAEQERSCDDRVITLGIAASDYAAHLLEVARSATRPGMYGFVSVAMARPSQLEGRLLAVLGDHDRTSVSRSRRVAATVGAFAAVALVSALDPVIAESAVIISSQATPVVVYATNPDPFAAIPKAVRESVSVMQVAVQPGGRLDIDLKTGAGLTIVGTNENIVRARITLGGRDGRDSWFSLTGDSTNARLTSGYRTRKNNNSSSNHVDLLVPRRFSIHVSSAGGELDIRDVEGAFTGSTGGGEITMQHVKGSASLATGGGEINVTNSSLSGSVTTGGGSVLIQGVTGGLRGSSGTGGVMYGGGSNGSSVTYGVATSDGARVGSDGKTYVSKSGGSISISSAPGGAAVSTGGGSITIQSSGGDVKATTGGGDVTVNAASGAQDLTTGAGDVTVRVEPGKPVTVTSGNGTVTLIVPRNLSADLDLETAFTNNYGRATRIRGDLDVKTTTTPDWDSSEGTPRRYVRVRQSVGGGGPKVKVRTVNGDIIIKER